MNKVEAIKFNDDIVKMYEALKIKSERDYLFLERKWILISVKPISCNIFSSHPGRFTEERGNF